jgi:hypothetical protein
VSGPAQLLCGRCQEPVRPEQEYCLECGARLGARPNRIEGVSAGVARRHLWAGAWIAPALVALAVAALGAGAAIAISSNTAAPAPVSVATGGNLTVTEAEPGLTPPEPTGAAATTKPPATPAPAATPPPANPATISWPRGRRGWTIVLLSLPQSAGRAAAADRADRARRAGLRRVGVLDSSRFASLHPGYYVVFHGVFGSQVEAASALQRARAAVSGAYTREIVP